MAIILKVWFSALITLRPKQNGRHSADDTYKRIFVNENVRISIEFSLTCVPKGPINSIPALVQIMAWCRSGDKPLSEPMMVSLLTHIYVTRPQWVIQNSSWGTHWKIALRWMSQNFTNKKWTLVKVMAWCHLATSHYLSPCWPISMLPYRNTWVNLIEKIKIKVKVKVIEKMLALKFWFQTYQLLSVFILSINQTISSCYKNIIFINDCKNSMLTSILGQIWLFREISFRCSLTIFFIFFVLNWLWPQMIVKLAFR